MKPSTVLAIVIPLAIVAAVVVLLLDPFEAPPEKGTQAPREDFGAAVPEIADASQLSVAPDSGAAQATPDANDAREVEGIATETPESLPFALASVVGRVVDDRRRPVAGARVRLVHPIGASFEARTGADGSFRIDAVPRDEERWLRLGIVAFDGKGGAAADPLDLESRSSLERPETWLWGSDPSGPRDVGTIALGPGHPLEILAIEGSAPAAGAALRVEWGFERILCALDATGADGRFTIPSLPAGVVFVEGRLEGRIGRAEGKCAPGAPAITLALEPVRAVGVLVRDKSSGAPIPVASVRVEEMRRIKMEYVVGDFVWSSVPLDLAVPPTDEFGRTRIVGLPRGSGFEAIARKDGFLGAESRSWREGDEARIRIPDDADEVVVELVPLVAREVRIPIVAGEVPVPPEGTLLAIRERQGAAIVLPEARPDEGRIEGGAIVIEGVPPGYFHALAETSALEVAPIFVAADAVEGKETSFRPARSVEVHVVYPGGEPAEGANVTVHNQGNNLVGSPVRTDAAGHGRVEALHADLVDVYITHPADSRCRITAGSADLSKGDAFFEATLPREAHLRVQVFVDGEPRLPGRLDVRATPLEATVQEEEPEEGLLSVRVWIQKDTSEVTLYLLGAGFLPANETVPVERLASDEPIRIDLERAGAIVADVAGREGRRVELAVEEWKKSDDTWAPSGYFRLNYPNDVDERFRFEPLAAGRYRVVDRQSGLASDGAWLDPATSPEARVFLDLRATRTLKGRVEAPPGTDFTLVRVVVEGEEIESREDDWGFVPGMAEGHRVRNGGVFSIDIPTDRPVTLVPWHPYLVPAAEGGAAVVSDAGGDEIVLRLAAGNEVSFPVPKGAGRDWQQTGIRIALFRGAASGTPAAEFFAPIEDGIARFGGFEPGTWTLWIDPRSEYAPVTLEGIELHAGAQELSSIEFRKGSSIRVRVLVPEGTNAPRILLGGRPEGDGPLYQRYLNSNGESEVVLPGFGPGTFRVWYRSMNEAGEMHDEIVALDGEHDLTFDLDLR